MSLFTKIFGTASQRELKSIYPIADKVDALEEEYKALTDAQLQAKTPEFKARLANGETLDDILPEAFAACREAAWRVLGLRPYRVQVVGGIVLHQGRIAEMRTGEGKTLVATLPAYLNALAGKGVHVITVNDYLAKRDSEWMGKVYRFMGLTVGLVSVTALDLDGNIQTIPAEHCGLGYRKSIFSDGQRLVLEARFQLESGDPDAIRARMDELAARRKEKQPLEYPSAGSMFKRPEGYFAAALIDQCGLKGFAVGGAQVSEKHAGFVVNRGGATCADVLELVRQVQARVQEQTGVALEMEVKVLR